MNKLLLKLIRSYFFKVVALVLISGFGGIFLSDPSLANLKEGIQKVSSMVKEKTVQITQTPTPTPTVYPCLIDGNIIPQNNEADCIRAIRYFNSQQTAKGTNDTSISYPTNTVNSDPIINCEYKYLGVQRIKKSLCDKQFECQIGGAWYLYTDREQCKKDQTTNSVGKYKPSNIGTTNNSKYYSCKKDADDKLNQCKTKCESSHNYDKSACSYAFGTNSPNGYNDLKFGECLSEIGEDYNKCLEDCSATYSTNLNLCLL